MLENKAKFSNRLMKIFLSKIGLYPKGTFVELNTKEVAQVIKHNPKMPLSPVVRVVFDGKGKKVEKTRDIDLSKETRNYIVRNL